MAELPKDNSFVSLAFLFLLYLLPSGKGYGVKKSLIQSFLEIILCYHSFTVLSNAHVVSRRLLSIAPLLKEEPRVSMKIQGFQADKLSRFFGTSAMSMSINFYGHVTERAGHCMNRSTEEK